jgi:hypothetical protein
MVPKVKDYIAQSQEIDDHHDAIAFKKSSKSLTVKKLYRNKKRRYREEKTYTIHKLRLFARFSEVSSTTC